MLNTANMEENKATCRISFAAIDPYIEVNSVLPTETPSGSRGMINWGTGNVYPYFLYSLYESVPTLGSIIKGTINYVLGDSVNCIPFGGRNDGTVNRLGDTALDLVKELARDYLIFGGFAIQVIRNRKGEVSELYWLDMRYVRSNKDNTVFYYSEKWDKFGAKKTVIYPAFMPGIEWETLEDSERNNHASSVVYVKENRRNTYPTPEYIQAIRSCETERCIDSYHLNSINNGFSDGMIVNFNNGIPEDKMKKEIEKAFNEKFSGHQNAGRIMFSWNPNKESQTTLQMPQTRDYGEKYNTLAARTKQQIFTAFRANPNLFGIPTENNGFSNEEYIESFKLYNKTQVSPIQTKIKTVFAMILGQPDALMITPFSLEATTGEA